MAFLEAICERSLPFTKNVITFFLFAEEVQVSTGELWYISVSLNLTVNELVSQPLGFARTVSEMYLIPDIFREVCFNNRGNVMINLIATRCSTYGLLLFLILLHISNGSVSTSLVGHVLYSADLMAATYIPHILLMVHRYIYSRYSPVFSTLYQLYHSLPSSTLYSSSSLYLKLQHELL